MRILHVSFSRTKIPLASRSTPISWGLWCGRKSLALLATRSRWASTIARDKIAKANSITRSISCRIGSSKLFTGMDVVVRTTGDPLASVGALRAASQQFDPDQVLFGFKSLDEQVSGTVASQRFAMILLSIFAVLALVLSTIGVYGVISYLVSERTREIGVRVALGAQRSDVLRLILGDGARLTFLGVAIGLAASLGLTRLLAKMLFGVRASDPATLIVVSVILSAVAFLACYIPARRATRVDPMVALRYE